MKKSPVPDDQALDDLFEKYRLAPDSYVFVPLADACRKMGRLDEALEICLRGVERHPGYASGHVVKGKCLFDRGEYETARVAFEAVLDLDDSNLVALKFLGMIEADAGRLDSAQRYFQKILAIDPDNREITRILRDVEERGRARLEGEPVKVGDAEDLLQAGVGAEVLDLDDVKDLLQGDDGVDAMEAGDGDEALQAAVPELADDKPTAGEATESKDDVAVTPDAGEPEDESQPSGDAIETSAELASITLADIFASQGYVVKAAKIYREVLKKEPRNDAVRRKLAELSPEAHDVDTGNDSGRSEPTSFENATVEMGTSPQTDPDPVMDDGAGDAAGRIGEMPDAAAEPDEEPVWGPAPEYKTPEPWDGADDTEKTGDGQRPAIDETDSLSHFRRWLKQMQK